nr:TonB family protein [Phenylobacterium aquaticum]
MAVWPHDAAQVGAGGKALIGCKVTERGLLNSCVVLSESPAGAGFGAAAVMVSSQFLMKPAIRNGKPVESEVRIPITFPSYEPPQGGVEGRMLLPVALLTVAPTYAQVVEAYPAKARAKGAGGRAALSCNVRSDGQIQYCTVLTEDPGGLGFGAAAKSLAPLFKAPTTLADGRSTRGAVMQISVVFVTDMLKSDSTPVVGKPNWISAPTAQQFTAAMPKGSEPTGTIRVALDCLIAPGGHVSDCKVASESPPDKGFGASALAVAPYVQVSVWTPEGLPTVGARLRVPFRFEFGAPPPPAPKP